MNKTIPIVFGIIMPLALVGSVFSPPAALAQESLTWEACLREAAQSHPDLIAAKEGIIQSEASKTIAATNAFPTVSASLSADTADSNTGSSRQFDYGLTGTQLLFNGFKTGNSVKSAEEIIKASRENFRFTSSEVRFRLRSAFINLLKSQELLKLTEDIRSIRKNNLDLIQLRYESGTEHKGALLNAQANLSQAESNINQAKRELETAQTQMMKELGRTQFSPIAVEGTFDVQADLSDTPDLQAIALNHPSYLRAEAQKKSASFDVKTNEGDYWPEVSLTGDISRADENWPPQNHGSSAGVRVSLPIFDGDLRGARVKSAKSVYRQLEQEERSTKDGIVLSLEQSWNDFKNAVEDVTVQQNFLTAATERAKISEQQYSVGLISFDNWTIIEDDLVKSKRSFLDAQAAALSAEASWIEARGETVEYEND